MKKYKNYFINFLNFDNNLIYFGVYEYHGLGHSPTLVWDLTFNNGGWLLYTTINSNPDFMNNQIEKNEIIEICKNWYKEILKN